MLTRRELLRTAAGTAAVLGTTSRGSAMNADSPAPRIIDPHVHVWKNDRHYPWPKELKSPPKEDALPGTLLDLMKGNGVEKTVIVHVIHYLWDCRYAGDVIKAHRDRFMGVCRVNPEADDAVKELDRWVRDYGFHGVRLSPSDDRKSDWINDRKRMDRIWSRAAELKIPMCILCPSTRLPDVERVIERHQDGLDVCIDHMADCPIDEPGELK